MEKNQANIYALLDQLRLRKAMYLGNDFTFKSLDSFISGFTMAASGWQLQTKEYPDFSYFSTWLLGHLKSHFGLGGGWCWQISNRHPGDDAGAFEEFFYFLDVFKSSSTYKKYIIVDKDASVNQRPSKIILTTMDNSATVWLDYLDGNGDTILANEWFINLDEAMNSLKREFGSFQHEWIVADSINNA